LTKGLREAFSVPDDVGVMVSEVYDGSEADRAGLRAGDVIVKMDRRAIRDIDDVQRVLNYFEPNDKLTLEIIRDKKRKQLEVVLGERKGPRNFGQWRQWMEPYYQNPPFLADPEW
jgi:serine protease Do